MAFAAVSVLLLSLNVAELRDYLLGRGVPRRIRCLIGLRLTGEKELATSAEQKFISSGYWPAQEAFLWGEIRPGFSPGGEPISQDDVDATDDAGQSEDTAKSQKPNWPRKTRTQFTPA